MHHVVAALPHHAPKLPEPFGVSDQTHLAVQVTRVERDLHRPHVVDEPGVLLVPVADQRAGDLDVDRIAIQSAQDPDEMLTSATRGGLEHLQHA